MFSDLTQNAVESGADTIHVVLEQSENAILLSVEDNGKGMNEEELAKATDPFWTDGIKHPGRKIGLGLPFLIQTAETTGGKWNLESKSGKGTRVTCSLDPNHIDTPPVGDVSGYFRHVLTFDGPYEMVISYKGSTAFTVRRSELLEALALDEEGSFTDAQAITLLGEYLKSLMEE